MDWPGFAALMSSLLLNGALAVKVLRKSRVEATAGDVATDAARDEHASAGWKRLADSLGRRLDATVKKLDELATEHGDCRESVAQLTEQNKNQGAAIVEQAKQITALKQSEETLRKELDALKRHLSACGTRTDSTECPIPDSQH